MIKMVKIPRMLLDHEYYKNLSDRAKVLYGILSEKMQEAERYGWIDENGSPYVVFPKKKMQEELSCSRYRLDLVTKELVTTDLIELVYGIGASLERRIYVHNIKERCPWIRVEYGIRTEFTKEADEPVKGNETSNDEEKVSMKTDFHKETGEGSEPKELRDSGDCSGETDLADLLKVLMSLGKEEEDDPAQDPVSWAELLGILASALS